ncbi:hypothetical protein FACS1894133_6370 [Clostridia bacterium]|nr:hypothetical protein FACS1894133_6370 [Clostridia bacterium]
MKIKTHIKIIVTILAAAVLFTSCASAPPASEQAARLTQSAQLSRASGTPAQPQTRYSTAVYEMSAGTVLFGENADTRRPIASITKEMLLLLLCERVRAGEMSPDDTVTATAHAASMDGATIWLTKGEQMRVRELVHAVILTSANDAAMALAEHMYGSEAACVSAMNARAASLRMYDTNFASAVGFDGGGAYSTAADVARLTAALFADGNYILIKDDMLTRLSSVRTGTEREAQLLNTNPLLGKFDGLLGGKTGTTDGAGYCLASAARRGNMTLVAVILGATDNDERGKLAKTAFETAFSSYEAYTPADHYDKTKLTELPVRGGTEKTVEVAAADSTVTTQSSAAVGNTPAQTPAAVSNTPAQTPAAGGGTPAQTPAAVSNTPAQTPAADTADGIARLPAVIVIPKGRSAEVRYEYYLPKQVTAPVQKGQPLGTITASIDGTTVYETYIVAARGIGRLTYAYCFDYVLRGVMG